MIQRFDAIAGEASSFLKLSVKFVRAGLENKPVSGRFPTQGWLRDRALVDRSFFGERVRGNFGGDLAVVKHSRDAAVGDRRRPRPRRVPIS